MLDAGHARKSDLQSESMRPPETEPSPLAVVTKGVPQPAVRRCVACGYDLFGLGDQPRCPECGLLNIPEGFRQQVWKLVDAKTVFFSNPLNPFNKRPPGWWWALDRPGDLKRAVFVAGGCVCTCFITIAGAIIIAGSIRRVVEQEWSFSHCPPEENHCVVYVSSQRTELALLGLAIGSEGRGQWVNVPNSGLVRTPRPTVVSYLELAWGLDYLLPALVVSFGVALTWLMPATVGLWTQIRKGLPPFAQAPRTILAASLYESHRLIYAAVLVGLFAAADAILRIRIQPTAPGAAGYAPYLLPGAVVASTLFAALSWIGPLRSDFTRQLIRSRRHALRIIMMYTVLLPWLVMITIVAFVNLCMLSR